MEEEIYEVDYENCSYCETTYYENDTGYREYGCSLWTGNADDNVPSHQLAAGTVNGLRAMQKIGGRAGGGQQ